MLLNQRLKPKLLTKETVFKDTPEWFQKEYTTFHEIVTRIDFPCTFGMAGEKRGELRYSYITHEDWSHLPETLKAFHELFNQRAVVPRHGFFLFVEPEKNEQSLDYYRKYFWDILQYIHEHDESSWPAEYPVDPEHHLWTFCFDGKPYFAFGNAPAYKQRKTRDLGNSLIIGFQPRIIFKGLDGSTAMGNRSREAIRKRVEKWDRLPKHPNISHYGDEKHREWKQFFIGDDIKPIDGECPFKSKH